LRSCLAVAAVGVVDPVALWLAAAASLSCPAVAAVVVRLLPLPGSLRLRFSPYLD